MLTQPTTIREPSGWQAELSLGFESRQSKTVLAHRRQRGPLAVQRPFYPEGEVCHAYVLHPPGGVVGGDQLTVSVDVKPGSYALLTTPGATKFYRSTGQEALQSQCFDVLGALEWLPQETIFFPEAKSRLNSTITLHDEASYIGWEVLCLGRPVVNERFSSGYLSANTKIYKDDKPLFIDRLLLQSERDLKGAAGFRDHPVTATLLATPAKKDTLSCARHRVDELSEAVFSGHAGVTLMNGVLVARYLGDSTAEAHRLFRSIWSSIRPLVNGRAAVTPRIWNT